MDTQSAADKLHRLQIESEMIQVKAAIDGIKRGDLYVFYTDRSGAGQVLFWTTCETFRFLLKRKYVHYLTTPLTNISKL